MLRYRERKSAISANGTTLKGYIAYDDAVKGKRPGILVIHEWWGHNEYARKRARMLAEQGYTALALDMYGNGKQAHHPDDAQKFSSEVSKNAKLAKARFDAALSLLKQEPTVDAGNIAAVGYCFGGSVALNMARIGEPLKAVVSFHGGLGTDHPAEAGKVKARIASFTGEDDPFIPAKQVAAFREEMDKAGVNLQGGDLSRRQTRVHQSGGGQVRAGIQVAAGLQRGSRQGFVAGRVWHFWRMRSRPGRYIDTQVIHTEVMTRDATASLVVSTCSILPTASPQQTWGFVDVSPSQEQ